MERIGYLVETQAAQAAQAAQADRFREYKLNGIYRASSINGAKYDMYIERLGREKAGDGLGVISAE